MPSSVLFVAYVAWRTCSSHCLGFFTFDSSFCSGECWPWGLGSCTPGGTFSAESNRHHKFLLCPALNLRNTYSSSFSPQIILFFIKYRCSSSWPGSGWGKGWCCQSYGLNISRLQHLLSPFPNLCVQAVFWFSPGDSYRQPEQDYKQEFALFAPPLFEDRWSPLANGLRYLGFPIRAVESSLGHIDPSVAGKLL